MIRVGPGTPRPSSAGRCLLRRNIGARSRLLTRRCSVKRHSVPGKIVLSVNRRPILRCFAVFALMAAAALIVPKAMGGGQAGITDVKVSAFDIEAHRGGRALFP